MAQFKVYLDQQNYEKVMEIAGWEHRPVDYQVEWLLKKAIQAAYRRRPPTAPGPWGRQTPSVVETAV